jgi:two-component system sensor histidine kinase MtrB
VTLVEPEAAGLAVLADKRRLAQVVTNLVNNAERHGDGCLAVTVAAAPAGVRITVDDAGPGVPAQQRERIFERFRREPTSNGERADGVGLGLAIVERHVRFHDGTVRVEDRPGGGARFVVELPVVRA